MALNTTKLGPSGVNALFKLYYGRDATKDELNYWSNKSDAELRPKLIPNSAVQLAKNKPGATPVAKTDPYQVSADAAAKLRALSAGIANNTIKTQEDVNKKIITPAEVKANETAAANQGNADIVPVKTQADIDAEYAAAAAKNPAIATLAKGGSTLDEIIAGLQSGDISGLLDWQGKPFSVEDQQAALAKGMEDNRLYYEAMQNKDKADAEAALAKKQADYQDYLIKAGQDFQTDKSTSDQQAADTGVLFSGSRVQKEKNLARAYGQEQAANLRNTSADIGNTARDFQYKYGNKAATGLNQYYNLGSNTYNPSTAQGGVTSNQLSSIYSPATYDYQGTKNTERSAEANKRAAGYLWNKGNKLLATGSNNQY